MVAGLAKSEIHASYAAGVGKVRERTITLGAQVIAIENVGSIRIVSGQRNWLLALIGLLIGGGAGMQVPAYGMLAWAVVGFGVLLVLINLFLPVERGLSIGTSDGRITMIVSKDATFLRRLLDLLVEKINSGSDSIVASFDITSGTVYGAEDGVVFRDPMSARPSAPALPDAAEPPPAITIPEEAPAAPPPPVLSAAEEDDALFSSEPEPALKPRPAPPSPARPANLSVLPERTRPHDPLLDGPSVAPSRLEDPERDWLKQPGRIVYGNDQPSPSSGLRWVSPVLLLGVLGGGATAAWMALGQPGGDTPISLLTPQGPAGPAETITLADAIDQPANAVSAGDAPAESTLAPMPAPVAPAATPEPAPAAETPAAPAPVPADPSAVTDFTPPEVMVARASGQRYRSRPSSADDVPILAETRAGGETLAINGRSVQPDGEWYRVALQDGRPAWFKASMAVTRARFADTFATTSNASLSFAATSPRILEPAEGVQLSGGPQPVRLAWSGPDAATIYIVEIETYDASARRWIDEPQPRRITVEAATEVAESFPATGAWRWRVRGVTPDGEQTQFSRWAAFTLRD